MDENSKGLGSGRRAPQPIPTAQRDMGLNNATNDCAQTRATGNRAPSTYPESLQTELNILARRLAEIELEREEIYWATRHLTSTPEVVNDFRARDVINRCHDRIGR